MAKLPVAKYFPLDFAGIARNWITDGNVGTDYTFTDTANLAVSAGLQKTVSLDADTVAVGDYGLNGGDGQVTIWRRSETNTWTLEQTINPPVAGGGDNFGYSLAVSGDMLIVGEPWSGTNRGQVHAYTRSGTTWTFRQTFASDDIADQDRFGNAVDLDAANNRCLVCARFDGTVGSAYTFTTADSGVTWTQEQKIESPNPAGAYNFGLSCALKGTQAIIAQINKTYIFEYAESWSLSLTVPNTAGGAFGASYYPPQCVDIDTDLAAISLGISGSNSQIYIYRKARSSWSLEQTITVAATWAWPSLDGDLLAVGRRGQSQVEVYTFDGSGNWNLQTTHTGTNSMGESVSVSGGYVAASTFTGGTNDVSIFYWAPPAGTQRRQGNSALGPRILAHGTNALLSTHPRPIFQKSQPLASADSTGLDPCYLWTYPDETPNGREYLIHITAIPRLTGLTYGYAMRYESGGLYSTATTFATVALQNLWEDVFEFTYVVQRGNRSLADVLSGLSTQNGFVILAVTVQDWPLSEFDDSLHVCVNANAAKRGGKVLADACEDVRAALHDVRSHTLPTVFRWTAQGVTATPAVPGDYSCVTVTSTTFVNILDQAVYARTADSPGVSVDRQHAGVGVQSSIYCSGTVLARAVGANATVRFYGPDHTANNYVDVTITAGGTGVGQWGGASSIFYLNPSAAFDDATTAKNKVDVHAMVAAGGCLYLSAAEAHERWPT